MGPIDFQYFIRSALILEFRSAAGHAIEVNFFERDVILWSGCYTVEP